MKYNVFITNDAGEEKATEADDLYQAEGLFFMVTRAPDVVSVEIVCAEHDAEDIFAKGETIRQWSRGG